MTDKINKTAIICNDSGQCLSIYKIDEKIWANFMLSDSSLDSLSIEKLPLLRVDKNKPFDVNNYKDLHESQEAIGKWAPAEIMESFKENYSTYYEIKPKWINFVMPYRKEGSEIVGMLREITDGKILIVRYYLFTGGFKETSFSLNGAKQAILKIVETKN